jgi:hypothetical protein
MQLSIGSLFSVETHTRVPTPSISHGSLSHTFATLSKNLGSKNPFGSSDPLVSAVLIGLRPTLQMPVAPLTR